jgi:hypothetical protein
MKQIKPVIICALGSVTWLLLGAGNLQAQDRPPQGSFDPAQMRQRAMERMREQFDVKDDTEWKAISERIEKVMQARRTMGGAGGPGGFGFPAGRGGPGGPGSQVGPRGPGGQGGRGVPPPPSGEDRPEGFGPPPGDAPGVPGEARGTPPGQGQFRNRPDGPGGMGGFARETSPEMDALRKALDNKASAAEIKAKLAELRAARKKKEAELEKAQDELREILSARQEAVAVTLGWLK